MIVLCLNCRANSITRICFHRQQFEDLRLDEYLQKLVRELGEAINDAINDSDEITRAIERLRAAGHNVVLMLEATIAFTDDPEKPKEEPLVFEEIPIEQRLAQISDEDRQFLRSLKIKFDNDD